MSAFNERSIARLHGIHPDLVKVITEAAEEYETKFGVNIEISEGLRTKERQAQLLKAGASQTMNSRHLTGHAVDIHFIVAGKADWSWPLFRKFAVIVKDIAEDHQIPVTWGGDWKKFKDGPHFELDRKVYP